MNVLPILNEYFILKALLRTEKAVTLQLNNLIIPQKNKNNMATNRTYTMVKPDAVAAGNTGAIIKMIEEAGFRILAMKMTQMTPDTAGKFYEVHKERPFYKDLCSYMSSGPIVPMILEKDNAVEDFRKLIGATNPADAAPGTIRKLFAKSIEANAIHGSDSDENAAIEGAFFFPEV
jgi:nucleoside-diphosphate kinase